MGQTAGRAFSLSWKIAWFGLLISLPVTSLPFLSGLLGDTQVAPLAMIPLGWLALTWLPYTLLQRKTRLPAESRPLFGFVLAALISSLLAFFIDIPSYKSHAITLNELTAFLTLGIGLCFYLTAITRVRASELNHSLKFISIGGMFLLAWSFAQGVVVWFLGNQYPDWMVTVHSWIASTSLLRLSSQMRVTGLAYEPSWLAHMLNMLYLPLWMAACRFRQSAFRFRLGKLILEDILLFCGLTVLFMTFSRISLLAFMLMLGWFIYLGVKSISLKIYSRIRIGSKPVPKPVQVTLSILVLLAFFTGFMGIMFGLAFFDPRIAQIFQLREQVVSGELLQDGLMPLANRLNFGERVVYWELGWRVFEEHPLLGVGLGNSGQFALQEMSSWAWEYVEVRRILFGETYLPNTKNLWTRLLSETGLAGTVFFITWLILQWISSRALRVNPDRLARAIGLAGQLALISLIVEGFSIDSFALPYWWITLGILTTAGFLSRQDGLLPNVEDKK